MSNDFGNNFIIPGIRQEQTLLSQVFFSRKNVDVLQTKLRYRVYMQSGGQIIVPLQSNIALLQVMQNVYEQSKRYVAPNMVISNVHELNERVLHKTVPDVLSSARFHDYYLKDINLPNPVPKEHPQLMTTRGTKVLDVTQMWL